MKFVLQKRCEFGQQFLVVGDDEVLGAWNPKVALPMQWSDGHIWTKELVCIIKPVAAQSLSNDGVLHKQVFCLDDLVLT